MVPAQTLTPDSAGPVISLVVPFYNEELVIDAFRSRIIPVMEKTGETFEIICVNDGSRDRTAEMLDAICAADSRFRALHFSRNFGHQPAVTAGINAARGQCAIIIDADLQDPPELIDELLAKWREGFEIVYAQRRARAGESGMKRGTAFMFYRTLSRITEINVPCRHRRFLSHRPQGDRRDECHAGAESLSARASRVGWLSSDGSDVRPAGAIRR
jgi:dolichol-phosphate mannosyltransferase